MPQPSFKLDWKGDLVIQLSEDSLKEIVADLGEIAETESKRELQPGHGVLTGDLKRSIHLAGPNDSFAGESPGPERGGKRVMPEGSGGVFRLALGSGLVYAMAIHQGWPLGYPGLKGSFSGYHYIVKGVDRMKPQWQAVVLRHRLK